LGSLLARCTALTQNQKQDFGSLLARCESDSHQIKIWALYFSSSGSSTPSKPCIRSSKIQMG